jgi:peptidoglycan/LPS O-acetylase OafA/YrhL
LNETEKYRPDIDGIRAIAVLSVVIYHAGFKTLGGGYAGVDVFFVISGYLITRYIAQRIHDDKFSLVEFYERRIRRIIPALFVLLLFAVAASFFTLLPADLYRFAKSVVATVLFVPNIVFWREAGYFGLSGKYKPLLHMWSLGVEEQFYIFFPIAMWIVSRWGRRATLFFLYFSFFACFALSIYGVAHRPNAAFYLVPFRAWELLLGALIAVRAFLRIENSAIRNMLSVVGLVSMIASFFVYTPDTAFPGLAAALPCVGTALVIYSNEISPTIAGSVLSFRPLVVVGLISYSLYLWHWPLLVFSQQYLGRALSSWETVFVVLSAVVVAALSWKFVEQPFRRRTVTVTRPSLFWKAATSTTLLLMMATVLIVGKGFPQRIPAQALRYAMGRGDEDHELARCMTTSVAQLKKGEFCHLGNQAPKPDFVVWGDSHAAAIAPVFKALANDNGAAGWLATRNGCAPLLGVDVIDRDRAVSGCRAYNEAVASAIEQNDIRTIFLVGRWQLNALGRDSQEIADGRRQVFIRDSESVELPSQTENMAVFERGLGRTLSRLKHDGKNVVLVMDVPNTTVDTPYFLAKAAQHGTIGQGATVDTTAYEENEKPVDAIILRLADQWHTVAVEPKSLLCKESQCVIAQQGESFYRDSHHLTTYGAMQLIDLFRPVFQRLGRPVVMGGG